LVPLRSISFGMGVQPISLHGDGSNNFGRFLSGAFLTTLSEEKMVKVVFYVLCGYVVL